LQSKKIGSQKQLHVNGIPTWDFTDGIDKVVMQHRHPSSVGKTDGGMDATMSIVEADGNLHKHPNNGIAPTKMLTLFIPKVASAVGVKKNVQGELDIVNDAEKFEALLDQTGLVIFIKLSFNPQIHFLQHLHIFHHGIVEIGSKEHIVIMKTVGRLGKLHRPDSRLKSVASQPRPDAFSAALVHSSEPSQCCWLCVPCPPRRLSCGALSM